MKNENENMPAFEDGQIDQELHERLCAYVFGELQGAERAAFEAELLRSPELQRERERLTATIGLVKSAVPDEGLSTAVRRDLVASARRSRFRFLSGRRLTLVAAAVVIVVGGVFAVRGFGPGRESGPFFYGVIDESESRDLVASASEPQPLVDRVAANEPAADVQVEGKEELELLRGLGYGGDDGPAATPTESLDRLSSFEERKDDSSAGVSLPEDGNGFFLAHGGASGSAATDAMNQLASLQKSTESTVVVDRKSIPAGQVGQVGHYATGGRGGSAPQGTRAAVKFELGPVLGQGQYVNDQYGNSYGSGDPVPGWESKEKKANGIPAAAPAAPPPQVMEKLEDLGYGGEGADETARVKVTGFAKSQREPVQTREQVVKQVEQLLGATRVAPGESATAMFFRYFGDSPFRPVEEEKISTFAVDVDTASYALARAYLNNGQLPPREAVRTEEFVNYFKADQPPPADGKPFAIGLELAPSLFASDPRTEMLRVTLRGRDVQDFQRQPLNLTFVLDVSGSMAEGGRLELVKRALALLLRQLGGADSVAVVKFSQSAQALTVMLPAAQRGLLEGAIRALSPEGGTNVEAGLRKGYEVALQNLARNAVNRVILCSDGVGNIGETSAQGQLALVKDARAKGIYLNTVGVGMGNHNDAFLEQLADEGDGVCNYVDSDAEAKRVFVDGLASLVQPIARDVKIQVDFDPAQVESWRLLGYEDRALRTEDFRNDKVDAGEVNAGHQVTALYEIVRHPSRSGPLATVRVRYKPPFAIDAGKEGESARAEAEQALEIARTLDASSVLPGFAATSNGYQRSALVAQFAEVLRQSVHARGDSLATLLGEARRLEKALGDPDFTEFVALLGEANPLLDARSKQETPKVQQLLDELSKLHYEQALRERKRELAAQAGEPSPSADEQREVERVEREAKEAIQRLEAEVSAEVFRARGVEPLSPEELKALREIGYAK